MPTKYQSLKKAATSYCKGKTKLSTVKKALTAYVKDATAKGKTKTEATATGNRAMKCPAKPKASKVAGVGKTRKRTATKKRTAKKK